MTKTLALIPAHNEDATIGRIVRESLRHVGEVLVIDDGSSDRTAQEASDAGAVVVRIENNVGKGEALRRGFEVACAREPDVIVTLDADGEHEPDEIPNLLQGLENADIVLGWRSRFRSSTRQALNGIAVWMFRLIDPSIKDTICGFRALRREVVPLVTNPSPGFAFEHTFLLEALAHRVRMVSVPIRTEPTLTSHVRKRDIIETHNHFSQWVFQHRRRLELPWWRRGILLMACAIGLTMGRVVERFIA